MADLLESEWVKARLQCPSRRRNSATHNICASCVIGLFDAIRPVLAQAALDREVAEAAQGYIDSERLTSAFVRLRAAVAKRRESR